MRLACLLLFLVGCQPGPVCRTLTCSTGGKQYEYCYTVSGNKLESRTYGIPGQSCAAPRDDLAAQTRCGEVLTSYCGGGLSISRVDPATGPTTGGIPLTVEGTGFSDTTRVSIGGQDVGAVMLQSSTRLQVTLPSRPGGLGPAPVSVRGANGSMAARDDLFRYFAGTTRFASPAIGPTGGQNPRSVLAADLNGDGKVDLAFVNTGSSSVTLRSGNGDGTFASPVPILPACPGSRFLAAADLDGDGRPDLILPCPQGQSVLVSLRRPDGSFVSPTSYLVGTNPGEVAAVDLDGDGRPDLAVTGQGGDLRILRNLGTGAFQELRRIVTFDGAWSLAAADLNQDGKPDLALAEYVPLAGGVPGGRVGVLLGRGGGDFQDLRLVRSDVQPVTVHTQVVTADLDGDGKLDLLTNDSPPGGVGVLLGNGDGSFQPVRQLNTGLPPFTLAAADLNGDGLPEVITGSTSGQGGLQMSQNLGKGAFGSPTPLGLGIFAHVTAADLNGDKRMDLVAVDIQQSLVHVMLNISE